MKVNKVYSWEMRQIKRISLRTAMVTSFIVTTLELIFIVCFIL